MRDPTSAAHVLGKLLLAVGVSAFVGYMVIVVGVATYTVATMH